MTGGEVAQEQENRTMKTNEQALEKFIAAKVEIDDLIEQIKAASDDHFGAHPDGVNYSHVGSAQHARDRLREIADFLGV